MKQEHGFDIFINNDAETLILGSFPSIKSREESFYYMHKSNRFYKILKELYNDEDFVNPSIEMKKQALKKHKIALYDVILTCDIQNSDDASINEVVPIDLDNILNQYHNLKKIAVLGSTAKKFYLNFFSHIKLPTYFLPSTSARNASYSLNKLVEIWKVIK